jgi:nucleoside diphosphate kinase
VGRFERTGLKFTAFKFFVPAEDDLLRHYNKDDAWFEKKGQNIVNDLESQGRPVEKAPLEYGKDIIRTIIQYMQQGPLLALVL